MKKNLTTLPLAAALLMAGPALAVKSQEVVPSIQLEEADGS